MVDQSAEILCGGAKIQRPRHTCSGVVNDFFLCTSFTSYKVAELCLNQRYKVKVTKAIKMANPLISKPGFGLIYLIRSMLRARPQSFTSVLNQRCESTSTIVWPFVLPSHSLFARVTGVREVPLWRGDVKLDTTP